MTDDLGCRKKSHRVWMKCVRLFGANNKNKIVPI